MSLKIDDRDAAISDIRLILSYDNTSFNSKIHENVIKRLMSLENGRISQELAWPLTYAREVSFPLPSLLISLLDYYIQQWLLF